MALVIQKYGGTSVGSVERIQSVARRVLARRSAGDQVVVVVSAMSGETNRLVDLATQINPVPFSREYDFLIASGEQVAVGLLSLAINTLSPEGPRARPLLGYQIGIKTDQIYSKARIQEIDTELLRCELALGNIPVVAGFQGVDAENNITTLGRGGSDTSAVAIAAALDADDCEIYTDVEGVYTTDPRVYAGARKISTISYEEMMEMASLGAKVLHIRAVELAASFLVPLHVRSSFNQQEGTRVISSQNKMLEKVVMSGVTADVSQAKFSLKNIRNRPGILAEVFSTLSSRAIDVDVIVQDVQASGVLSLSFTVNQLDAPRAREALVTVGGPSFENMEVIEESHLAKVSIVGVGMQNHPGVATKMFSLLAQLGIDIKLVTTSEIKISCLINKERAEEAVATLHRGFDLD